MQLKDFLPTPTKVAQETIATLLGLLISAWIISRVPSLQAMVNEAKPTNLTNSL